jgi:hypothetical protein
MRCVGDTFLPPPFHRAFHQDKFYRGSRFFYRFPSLLRYTCLPRMPVGSAGSALPVHCLRFCLPRLLRFVLLFHRDSSLPVAEHRSSAGYRFVRSPVLMPVNCCLLRLVVLLPPPAFVPDTPTVGLALRFGLITVTCGSCRDVLDAYYRRWVTVRAVGLRADTFYRYLSVVSLPVPLVLPLNLPFRLPVHGFDITLPTLPATFTTSADVGFLLPYLPRRIAVIYVYGCSGCRSAVRLLPAVSCRYSLAGLYRFVARVGFYVGDYTRLIPMPGL